MKRRSILTFLCVLLLASAATAQGPAPLADRLPANTLLYAGWAGQNPAFNQALLGQLLKSDQSAALLRSIYGLILENASHADEKASFEHVWAMADIVWRRPVAIALIDVSPPASPPEGNEATQPTGPPPAPFDISAVLMIDLGQQRDTFAQHLDALLETGEVPLEQTTVGELPARMLMTPIGPVMLAYVGETLMVTLGDKTLETLAALAAEASLARNPKFLTHMKDVAGADVQLAVYLDIERIRATVQTFLPPPPETPEGAEEPTTQMASGMSPAYYIASMVGPVWEAVGMDQATVVAGAISVDGDALHAKMRLFTPGPHHGLLTIYTGDPITEADLADVPADADYVSIMKLPIEKVYDELLRRSEAFPSMPDGEKPSEAITEQLAMMETMLGFSIREDLLGAVGQTWMMVSAPSQGGFLTGTVLSVEIADAAKLGDLIDKLERRLEGRPDPASDDGSAPAAVAPAAPDEVGEVEEIDDADPVLATMRIGDTDIRYVRRAPGRRSERPWIPMPVAPAWAVHGDRLYMALYPQVIAAVLQRGPVTSLTSTPQFRTLRAKLAARPCSLVYTNTPKILRQVYNFALIGWTTGAGAGRRFGVVNLEQHWLPPLTSIERYLQPEMQAVSADDGGITWEWYGSVPIVGALTALNTVGAASTAMLPTMSRARGKAKEAVSSANLHAIGSAAAMYAAMHDNEFPENFEALIEEGLIMPHALKSSHSPGQVQMVNGVLMGDVGFIYLKPHLSMDSGLIMAYEKPEYYGHRGTNVARVDGSVTWLDMADFQELLERTQAAREAAQDNGAGF
ncbi:hypothetical protein LCGC14_0333650 [marine sediment metagenome]|uniref:DUF1559 domain-containing protein n=1 Tax=marine sediment metagenome TaxID=412755 RepID=A0A0F9TYM1_9ZZZZ|nr:hypothetical protein [Phycisphaerae bacterium]HDZ43783.1 hypothetical protein [Phycisphaerae bacterium]